MGPRRRDLMALAIAALGAGGGGSKALATAPEIIDDLSSPAPRASNGAAWEFVADRVMGGVSAGSMRREVVAGRPAIRLTGTVSLANNGGFLQIALDLAPGGGTVDASGWRGIALDVCGNDEDYNLHLRTADVRRPWQSYRRRFHADPTWRTVELAFADFTPHRLEAPLDLTRLRRLGIVAIGRAFTADVAVASVRFF